MEHLGKIPCNSLEEVWISLGDIQGRSHLELRVRPISATGKPSPLSERGAILLPIDQLQSLLRLLTQIRELCINRGLLYEPDPASAVTMQHGESINLPLQMRGTVSRRDPRIPLRLPVECRLVDSEAIRPPKPVSGEIRDISLRGAQVWLPQRLPRFKRVDIAGLLDGSGFQARAQIVNVELESNRDPATGFHRHGLRWVAMEPGPREILTTAIASRSESGQAVTPSHRSEPLPDTHPPVPPEDRTPPAGVEPAVPGEELSEGLLGASSGASLSDFLERRRAPRVALPQPVPVRARGQAAMEVRLLDLSLIGGRIEHVGSLQPGSPCVLEFPAASSPLALSALVIHSSALGDKEQLAGAGQLRYQSGLTFVEVAPAQQAVLARIVQWLALGGTAEGILTLS